MKEQKRKVYDSYVTNIYTHTFDGFDEIAYKAAASDIIKVYGQFFPSDKKAKILDVGCGPGHIGYALKSLGYLDTYGIDISPEQIELCSKMGVESAEAEAFEFLRSSSDEYDLIFSTAFLEHQTAEEAVDYLTLIRKALKPGGRFICSVPNANSPFGARLRYIDITHEQSFTENSLRQLFIATEMHPDYIGDEIIPVSSVQGYARRLVSCVFRAFWRLFMMAEIGKDAFGVPLNYKLVGVCSKR